jgi:hypothetical protein
MVEIERFFVNQLLTPSPGERVDSRLVSIHTHPLLFPASGESEHREDTVRLCQKKEIFLNNSEQPV